MHCRGFSSISEWKRSHSLVWGESNASWQWIVPIDSTALNHFLFREPLALVVYCMCVRCVRHLYNLFCWNRLNVYWIRTYGTLRCLRQAWMNCQQEKNRRCIHMTLIGSDWSLKVREKSCGPGRSTFMLIDETKVMTWATFGTNTQKIHGSIDPRPNTLNPALWYDLLFWAHKERAQWQQYQCKISRRGMEL